MCGGEQHRSSHRKRVVGLAGPRLERARRPGSGHARREWLRHTRTAPSTFSARGHWHAGAKTVPLHKHRLFYSVPVRAAALAPRCRNTCGVFAAGSRNANGSTAANTLPLPRVPTPCQGTLSPLQLLYCVFLQVVPIFSISTPFQHGEWRHAELKSNATRRCPHTGRCLEAPRAVLRTPNTLHTIHFSVSQSGKGGKSEMQTPGSQSAAPCFTRSCVCFTQSAARAARVARVARAPPPRRRLRLAQRVLACRYVAVARGEVGALFERRVVALRPRYAGLDEALRGSAV